jgi:chromosome segregation ATPase
MVEQELTDARTELESAQNSAKQTKAALQELMKALAAASEENDKAEMAVMAAQEKVVALLA